MHSGGGDSSGRWDEPPTPGGLGIQDTEARVRAIGLQESLLAAESGARRALQPVYSVRSSSQRVDSGFKTIFPH